MTEEKIKHDFLELDENERNKEIVKNAVEYIKYKEKEYEKCEDIDIQIMLYCLGKMASGKERTSDNIFKK